VSFKVFREKFASKVGLAEYLMTIEDGVFGRSVQITCALNLVVSADRKDGGVHVSFLVDFELRTGLQGIIWCRF